MNIPELGPHCGSWVVTRPDGRTFELYRRQNVLRAAGRGWRVETAVAYLRRINEKLIADMKEPDATRLPTPALLLRIESLQEIQKTHPSTDPAWHTASKLLQPCFAEMAKREPSQKKPCNCNGPCLLLANPGSHLGNGFYCSDARKRADLVTKRSCFLHGDHDGDLCPKCGH